jgi:hypothetical protein
MRALTRAAPGWSCTGLSNRCRTGQPTGIGPSALQRAATDRIQRQALARVRRILQRISGASRLQLAWLGG